MDDHVDEDEQLHQTQNEPEPSEQTEIDRKKEYDNVNAHDDDHDMDERPQQQSQKKGYTQQPSYAGTSSTDVECAGFFDDYLYRNLFWSGIICFFSLLGIGHNFSSVKPPDCGYDEDDEEYRSIIIGYIFSGLGLTLILFGSLITFILSVLRKRALGFMLCILIALGSVLYIIGSWIVVSEVPYIYCIVGANSADIGGRGAVIFGEFLFIGALSMLLAIDIWRSTLFDAFRLRMYAYCGVIAVSALILFVGYAVLGYYLRSLNLQHASYVAQDYTLTGAGWFLIFFAMLMHIIVVSFIKRAVAHFVCSVLLILATLVTAIGYWALNHRDYPAQNAYFIGLSFFLIMVAVILILDMSLGNVVKRYVLKR